MSARSARPNCCAATATPSPRATRPTTRRAPPSPTCVHLEQLAASDKDFALDLYEPVGAGPGERRFKIYRTGEPVSLSAVLPVLQRLGVEVVDERPYELRCADRDDAPGSTTSACACRRPTGSGDYLADDARERFQDAFAAAVDRARPRTTASTPWCWSAGLTWRQAMVLRAYAKYLRQAGSTFSQDYMEDTLRNNVHTTRLLVAPVRGADVARTASARAPSSSDALLEELDGALDEVA